MIMASPGWNVMFRFLIADMARQRFGRWLHQLHAFRKRVPVL
jgi:hypothetical protein